ncbi:MAG: PE-PPE domain-containing protein [Mycobacterium sp.]|nr:PE-PPE domain-containing protein [Mycobacterium sp.]
MTRRIPGRKIPGRAVTRRTIAGMLTLGLFGASGGLGTGAAAADTWTPWQPVPQPGAGPYAAEAAWPTPSPLVHGSDAPVVYALGGARAPGIPWVEYTMRAGLGWFPDSRRDLIDYPAGAPFSWMPQGLLPPGPRDNVTIGEAATDATNSLNRAIWNGIGTDVAVVGLSQGTLALDQEQVRLAGDPKAPPRDQLTFTTIGDPTSTNGLSKSFLAGIFGPGEYIPLIDYTMPKKVDSQYDANRIVAAYDGLADFPDRPENPFAVANAIAGSTIVHTSAAFTTPEVVPPQNIKTEVNSKGAQTTSFLIPINHLPLTLPLRYLGIPDGTVDMIDGALQPIIDAGYSRNDNPDHPVTVDPNGMDPIAVLDPQSQAAIDEQFAQYREILSAFG